MELTAFCFNHITVAFSYCRTATVIDQTSESHDRISHVLHFKYGNHVFVDMYVPAYEVTFHRRHPLTGHSFP